MENLFKLRIDDGKGNSKTFEFDQDMVIVGRDPSSDLVIDDIEISRKHLIISREKGGFFAEDNHSTNGTFRKGKQLAKKTVFQSGEKLVLGEDHTIELEIIIPEPKVEEETLAEPMTAALETPPIEEEPQESVLKQAQSIQETQSEAVKSSSTEKEKPQEKEKTKKPAGEARPKWLVILLAVLVFIIIFCVIPFIVIEVTNQWCDLFAGFFNSLSPGVCP